jgi:uncharacterized membrane protein
MFLSGKDNHGYGPPVMSLTAFRQFFVSLVHPTPISVLISMLSVMVNTLKLDPTCDIEHEYPKLWPSNRVSKLVSFAQVIKFGRKP